MSRGPRDLDDATPHFAIPRTQSDDDIWPKDTDWRTNLLVDKASISGFSVIILKIIVF